MQSSARRRWAPALAAAVVVLGGAAATLVIVRAGGAGGRRPGPAAPGPAAAGTPSPFPTPGAEALVDVSVATLWLAPEGARPVDLPATTRPVDVRRWVSTMTLDDKRALVGRLATQALYGDRVQVLEVRGTWARVAVARQPSSLDRRGYPGWLPAVQLAPAPPAESEAGAGRSAVVARPLALLRFAGDRAAPPLELSYDTTLPVLATDDEGVTVSTPGGGRGRLAEADVTVVDDTARPVPSGADLVASARMFSGLPYLWAGTSSLGFDCSGFTSAVYGAHGVVLPRDADDQAAVGTAVDLHHLQAGDLLFFATGADRTTVHHVAMYVGDGRMIQSPATGRTVETVPVDTPAYAREFWGARRVLPPAP